MGGVTVERHSRVDRQMFFSFSKREINVLKKEIIGLKKRFD